MLHYDRRVIVRTVLGDIAPGELGGCDAHERDAPNELLFRNPTRMDASARATTHLPTVTPRASRRPSVSSTAACTARSRRAGKPGSEYPTFRAGHVENVLGEAITESNRDGRWVEVRL